MQGCHLFAIARLPIQANRASYYRFGILAFLVTIPISGFAEIELIPANLFWTANGSSQYQQNRVFLSAEEAANAYESGEDISPCAAPVTICYPWSPYDIPATTYNGNFVCDLADKGQACTPNMQKAGVFYRWECPAGWIGPIRSNIQFLGWHCGRVKPDRITLSINAAPSLIPTGSRVENRHVLTMSKLSLSLMKGAAPASGTMLNLMSNRGPYDIIDGPSAPTDGAGNATAEITTRNQPGDSVVTASNSDVTVTKTGSVTWLPAKYESTFTVTCYVLSKESDFSATTTTSNACGLPKDKSYRTGFLADVAVQGSGQALDGTFIHYNSKTDCYNTDMCARTATNQCAAVGTTIAVDRTIIPLRSSVNVDILGQRLAQDTGGKIIGYHIDDYMGATDRSICKSLGVRNSDIQFLEY